MNDIKHDIVYVICVYRTPKMFIFSFIGKIIVYSEKNCKLKAIPQLKSETHKRVPQIKSRNKLRGNEPGARNVFSTYITVSRMHLSVFCKLSLHICMRIMILIYNTIHYVRMACKLLNIHDLNVNIFKI